ncbi:hypothetical protein GCK72_024450 [Caenorhabditis remanei]|uniref:Uncharacterized protein n=1 Tax=Caenorhabditis remanei TaxID=31234 RepID=A0A6A5FZJ5_CAERE|nr:hypothetical protein GCK72_024450 [Caenorhabditis remanei]KAF1747983.1 hypothetical protein GCK72_024450 [Caenorhabditis remanei]
MGSCFSKRDEPDDEVIDESVDEVTDEVTDEANDEEIDEAPSEAIRPILNDPLVNYVSLFISGKSLIKPLHLSSNQWIMCEGSCCELFSELQKMERFDLVILYVSQHKPSMSMPFCVDMLRSTYTLANVWRAFFQNNGWGRNGEKGDKKIVELGYRKIFLIRAEVKKLCENNLQNYNEISKVLNHWFGDIYRAILLL